MFKKILIILFILLLLPNYANAQKESGITNQAIDIVSMRTANSKTFDLGNNEYQLEIHSIDIHYKDNYLNENELWKDIDLTVKDNHLDTTPYVLDIGTDNITFIDKRSGEKSTLALINVFPPIPYEIVPSNMGVSFRFSLPDAVSFQAQYKVTGKNRLIIRAYDDIGEIKLNSNIKNGILTETFNGTVKDKITGNIRQKTGNIRIDPTLTIQPSDQDSLMYENDADTNYGTLGDMYCSSRNNTYRSVIAWDLSDYGLTSATITSVNASLYYYSSLGGHYKADNEIYMYRTTKTWIEDEVTWNSYTTGNAWTSAGGDYNTTYGANATMPGASTFEFVNWNVTDLIKDAIDNRSNQLMLLMRFKNEDEGTSYYAFAGFRTNNYTDDTDLCPKLIIVYTVPVIPPVLMPPYDFIITSDNLTATTINWTAGNNSVYTMLRASVYDYPQTPLDGSLIYYGNAESENFSQFLSDKTYYGSGWGFDSDNTTYSGTYTKFNIGGEDMVISHLLVLIPLFLVMILSFIWSRVGLLHLMGVAIVGVVAFMAISNTWELIFFPVLVGVGIIELLLFSFCAFRGDLI